MFLNSDDVLRKGRRFDPEEDSDWELDCDSEDEEPEDIKAPSAATHKPPSEENVTKARNTLPAAAYEPPPEENDTEMPNAPPAAADKPPLGENVTEAQNTLPAAAYDLPPEENDIEMPNAPPAATHKFSREANVIRTPDTLPAAAYESPPRENETHMPNIPPVDANEPLPLPKPLPDDPKQRKKPQKRPVEEDELPTEKIPRNNNEPKVKLLEDPTYVSLYDEATTQGKNGRVQRKPSWMTQYVVKRKRIARKSKKE